ncbi:aldehyde dehydrogenase family protein [Schleiferiaceae bacterium]|nr:aldehyde dehydrogenase family protein [Schleiferiaceae bacterium]MDB9929110.1 aldehyde dehydrogenase family protein [Schleiferiaceae bacterium]
MNLDQIIALQRAHAPVQARTSLKYRLQKLDQLRRALQGPWQATLAKALHEDFGKSPVEVGLTEIFPTLDNLKIIRKNLKRWCAPQKVKTPLPLFGSTSYTQPEPKGSTLVIAPWNYPIFLSLHPLCTSFAAGNTVLLKPSEHTPKTSAALAALVAEIFKPEEASVVTGGVDVSTAVLKERFDHIFFTGSTAVGKIVMEAASKHLCSVTLELGGKSPTIVDETANAFEAGQRVAWAKFTNAGQICIAPDHIYVHARKLEDFKRGVAKVISKQYGEDPTLSKDYVRIVNDQHYKRLTNMLREATEEGGAPFIGGTANAEQRKISPAVFINPSKEGALMKEEIFGPLLPVFSYTELQEPLQEINSREHPLVVYIYSKSKRNIKAIQQGTRAGATAVNMSLLQIANNYLPFGGTGHSGIGKTNGHAGFLEFTNTRSAFYQWGFPVNKILAPPYTSGKAKLVQRLIKNLF